MMTITMTMRKIHKYGKMVKTCTCRYRLNYCTLLIAGGRSKCACNAPLPTDLMRRPLHQLPLSSHLHHIVLHAHSQATFYKEPAKPQHRHGLQDALILRTRAMAMAVSGTGTRRTETATSKVKSTTDKVTRPGGQRQSRRATAIGREYSTFMRLHAQCGRD
jgi:hypothetical protein